jgi:hypothetical protein
VAFTSAHLPEFFLVQDESEGLLINRLLFVGQANADQAISTPGHFFSRTQFQQQLIA